MKCSHKSLYLYIQLYIYNNVKILTPVVMGTGFGRTDPCSNPRNTLGREMEPNHPEFGLDPDVARRVNRVQTHKKKYYWPQTWCTSSCSWIYKLNTHHNPAARGPRPAEVYAVFLTWMHEVFEVESKTATTSFIHFLLLLYWTSVLFYLPCLFHMCYTLLFDLEKQQKKKSAQDTFFVSLNSSLRISETIQYLKCDILVLSYMILNYPLATPIKKVRNKVWNCRKYDETI